MKMCRFKRNRIYEASVDAVIMSREVMPRVVLYVFGLFLFRYPIASSYVLSDNCIEFDINQLEDYLSKLNLENVPTVNMMIGEFKCPVTALPFGALKSDWSRLLLLQRAQPEESIFREKLGRLFRILVSAYFRMEERFDVTEPGVDTTSSLKVSSFDESTVTVNSIEGATEPNVPMTTAETTHDTIETCATPTIVLPNGVSFPERITFDFNGRNATIENRSDNSSRISDNISTTAIPLSGGGNRTVSENKTIIASKDVSSFPAASREAQKSADVSNNYTSTFNEGTLRTNALDATGMKQEINSSENFSLQPVISTSNDFTKDQSIARNFTRDKIATNDSTVIELNAGKDDLVTREISRMEVGALTEPTVTKADSITTFSTDSDISGAMRFRDDKKPTTSTRNVAADETSQRIFVAEITTNILNSTEKDKGSRKTNGRGDYPISHGFSNFVDSDENEIDKEREVSFSTVQYRPVTEWNFAESENISSLEISNTKGTTEKSHVYSDKIAADGVATSTESFSQSLSNRRTTGVLRVFEKIPRHFSNSTFSANKIRKPTMYENSPMDNDFWKFLLRSRTLSTSTGKAALTLETEEEGEEEEEEEGRSTNVKKRGSLNTDVGKNFRWFYNFVHEDEGHSGNDPVDQHGIHIQCKEKEQRNDGK